MATTFEEYWDAVGSRKDIADHKERARLAWNASYRATVEALPLTQEWHKGWAACQLAYEENQKRKTPNVGLCGMSFSQEQLQHEKDK
jgi:hypothetical protein